MSAAKLFNLIASSSCGKNLVAISLSIDAIIMFLSLNFVLANMLSAASFGFSINRLLPLSHPSTYDLFFCADDVSSSPGFIASLSASLIAWCIIGSTSSIDSSKVFFVSLSLYSAISASVISTACVSFQLSLITS